MTTNRARLVSVLLLLAASLLLVAGCGGDDSSSDSKPSKSGTSDSSGDSAAKTAFTNTCGGCHTLADAGTSGTVGPDLDASKLDEAGIRDIIAKGRGAMPPNLLEGDEADAVAAYIAANHGK